MKKPERKIIKQRIKEYRNLVRKIYDWDFCYILEVERLQLERTYKCLEKESIDYDNKQNNIRWMKIASKILDMYLKSDWWSIDFSVKPHKYKVPYVNVKNANRFFKNWSEIHPDIKDYMKVDLYEQKLWNLYHKIRLYFMQSWWS